MGGGGVGAQHVHMRMLKAGTIFPSLPWLHMSYGIQLRPLKNKAIPSIFLRSLAKFSARVTVCVLAFRAALSAVCMHPLCPPPLGIPGCRPACWLTARRACWMAASQLARQAERGKNRGRERERERQQGMGSLEFGAHRILSSSLAPSTSLPVSSKLPSLGVFLRQHPLQSPSGTLSGTRLIINNEDGV